MRADKWLVNYLVEKGVTDVFGIPGVVIMDFLYAIDEQRSKIVPHLCYHEQGAAYAACGYAQLTGKLGVAYSTRGPGFTNMITAIADAYYDSIPVMFITAHSKPLAGGKMRIMDNQEIDTASLVWKIVKKVVRIDEIDNFQTEIRLAYAEAVSGRKGPVVIDILSELFSKDVSETIDCEESGFDFNCAVNIKNIIDDIEKKIKVSRRPIFLIGNGARGQENNILIKQIAHKFKIPILSSRVSQDIVSDSQEYFGYIGSRATRYSNFILTKADLVIVLGNRMAFPVHSKSFLPVFENKSVIRVDIDSEEFYREIPNSITYQMDVTQLLPELLKANMNYCEPEEWLETCMYLKKMLEEWDNNFVIQNIKQLIEDTDKETSFICDVGNHSFWVTIAYAYSNVCNRILYSGSFGTLGSALPKAIGAYYAKKKSVICFVGDQGVQFNIQEMQFISHFALPITIIILNNASSGMIMERERERYGEHLVHTTTRDGYSFPDFQRIAYAYGIQYYRVDLDNNFNNISISDKPTIIELLIDPNIKLMPYLPMGNDCQNLFPKITEDLYSSLVSL